MFSLIIISGVPGAGKTTLAKKLEMQGYVLLDDPVEKPTFEAGKKYVLTDPNLCFKKVFDLVNRKYPNAYWIFFKPSAISCWQNVQKRLKVEPEKVISYKSFLKFATEYEANFSYFLKSTKEYEVAITKNGLV